MSERVTGLLMLAMAPILAAVAVQAVRRGIVSDEGSPVSRRDRPFWFWLVTGVTGLSALGALSAGVVLVRR